MSPEPTYLTCCTPRYAANRAGGAAWVHSDRCEVARGRVSNVVLPPELEAHATPSAFQKGAERPMHCEWHYPLEFLTADLCDGPRCTLYREAWSDRDDDMREVVR